MHIENIINLQKHPLEDQAYRHKCRAILEQKGVCMMEDWLTKKAITAIVAEAMASKHHAYYCKDTHNVYLTPFDNNYSKKHVVNRQITSSKGCIADDIISDNCPLRILYNDNGFKDFLQCILAEEKLYPYKDSLASVNIHYASAGHELGWHFDNSSFAITLLLQAPDAGGQFQYVKALRKTADGKINFQGVEEVLDGKRKPQTLDIKPGTLVLFRGRDCLHRVTPTIGDKTRILSVLAYNTKPNIELSQVARMTFYGRMQ